MAHQFLRSTPSALRDPLAFGSEQEANATDASIIFSLHHNQSLFESANLDDNDLTSRPLYRGHQRRQSVAKLLPDVSKLRLLSWLVEASNELINCDIAIMDGVYGAKQRRINLNNDSLALFWNHQEQQQHHHQQQQQAFQPILAEQYNLISQKYQQQQPVAAAMPVKPHRKAAASKGNNSNDNNKSSLLQTNASTASASNIGNDSSSVAGISIASWLTPRSSRASAAATNNSDQAKQQQQLEKAASKQTRPPTSSSKQKAASVCASAAKALINKPPFSLPTTIGDINNTTRGNNNNSSKDHFCDSNRSEDDDNNSAAGSSSAASSSGINGSAGSGSISSAANISSSSVLSTSRGSSITSTVSSEFGQQFRFASSRDHRQLHQQQQQQQHHHYQQQQQKQQQPQQQAPVYVNPVELLREKIKVTVMEHNHLQNLLVNMIRQHDELRALFNLQIANANDQSNHHQLYQHQSSPRSFKKLRFDLTEIADSLNDGCFCHCHSMPKEVEGLQEGDDETTTAADGDEFDASTTSKLEGSTLTLPPGSLPSRSSGKKQRKVNTIASVWSSSAATSNSNSQQQLKKKKFLRYKSSSNSNEINRRDLIEMMPDKLCENCFETHYWLHSCSLDLIQARENSKSNISSGKQHGSSSCSRDSNDEAMIARRNSNFIKLVQQEVRSTIGRSIELIDLIRKLSKSPDSINKKQLMRCFSNSIQLLTSVGNYIVPTQDMTSFLPEANKHAKTTLFCLPSNDFEHLLPYSSSINFNQQAGQDQQTKYHLAPAPVIPIRRRLNQDSTKSAIPNRGPAQQLLSRNPLQRTIEQSRLISNSSSNNDNNINIRKALKTINDNDSSTNNRVATGTITTSSSGVSSNNSSASSSIARGTVQQSSLTRAQTSSAILDGRTSHDLSLYEFSSFAKQRHTEDDMLFQSNNNKPKFWQSSRFNFIKKLLQVKQQRLLRKQSKDRRIYNNKIQHKFRLVMMDLSHFKKSQQLLSTENGVNSMLASMRNVLEFGLYLTLKLY